MILKAKERSGGSQLARYLLSMRENDHVEQHEVRGFVSDDLFFGESCLHLSILTWVDSTQNWRRCRGSGQVVFSELRKVASWSELRCTFSHFRDKDKNEVIIVL